VGLGTGAPPGCSAVSPRLEADERRHRVARASVWRAGVAGRDGDQRSILDTTSRLLFGTPVEVSRRPHRGKMPALDCIQQASGPTVRH